MTTTPPGQPDQQIPPALHDESADGGVGAGPASLAANLVGAVLGLVGTVIGVSLVIAGSGLVYEHTRTFTSGVDGGGITLLVLGVVVLGAVVVAGAWAPATPVLGGLVVSFFGVVGLLSTDVVETVSDTLPSDTDRGYLYSWVALGAMLTLGLLLLAAGLACSLARRRRA